MTEQKLYQFCDTMAASEYRSLIRPFLDISTLSSRLKAEECISTEYRMCDGSWHRMLFTVKKGMSLEMISQCFAKLVKEFEVRFLLINQDF